MGYNTVVVILNDGLDAIAKHPKQFVEGIRANLTQSYRDRQGMRGSFPVGNHCNPAQVVGCEHADTIQIVAVGHNEGKILAYIPYGNFHTEEGQVEILRQLADKLGYRLAKKPSKALT